MNDSLSLKLFFLLFLFGSIIGCVSSKNDTTQIMELIERECTTYRNGDALAHSNCWHIQPYSRVLVSTKDGKTYDVPPSNMVQTDPKSLGNGGTYETSNLKISVKGKSAWVSHDEVSTNKDGVATYTYEMKMLEKIQNEWKIVGLSVHVYK
jgi:hypothetical protein